MLPLKRKPVPRLQKNEHVAVFDNSGTRDSAANWSSVKDQQADLAASSSAFITTAS